MLDRLISDIEKTATSQFITGGDLIPNPVRYHICGLTAPYMAIKLLLLENDKDTVIPSFPSFIQTAISLTNITCPYAYIELPINNISTKIPLYYSSDKSQEEIKSNSIHIANDLGIKDTGQIKIAVPREDIQRVRGFSINTGWDTGGTENLLTRLKLGDKVESSVRSRYRREFQNYNDEEARTKLIDELEEFLRVQSPDHHPLKAIATVSMNTRTQGWQRYYGDYVIEHNYTKHTVQSHVVTVIGIYDANVFFMDPAGKTTIDIIKYMNIDDFFSAYNGIHTIFKIRNY